MARTSSEQYVGMLTAAGVELRGDENWAELKELAEKNGIAKDEETETEVKGIRFHTNNPHARIREFTLEVHGEDFKEIASTFEKTHQQSIHKKETF